MPEPVAAMPATVPLLDAGDPSRPVAWRIGAPVSAAQLMRDVSALARRLPAQRCLVNLCEQRYFFIVACCAALVRGQTSLLPQSRAPGVIDEVLAATPGSYACADELVEAALAAGGSPDAQWTCDVRVPAQHPAVIGFTSGSTGEPRRHPKRWGSLASSTALNAARIREQLPRDQRTARPWIVATVPPQHMYGIETSVLLPLLGDMAVHGGRPLFPADVAGALAEVPAPRVLVTTPVHLRALLASEQRLPELAVIVSATAPLEAALAAAVERASGAALLEMFGSTETCVIATRRTAREAPWRTYPGVQLQPAPDGTQVSAPWFDAPTLLQDVVDLLPDGRFELRGRNVDLIEVAGKRASLAELTRQLLAVPGVEDAVVFQPEAPAAGGVRRVAALVVAPGLAAAEITARLARSVDAAFIPRPLVCVPSLPRNEVGKLPRERLLAALRGGGACGAAPGCRP